MTILRTIVCDCCGSRATEGEENQGWHRWGALHGIGLDGVANPTLCRECLTAVATFTNALKNDKAAAMAAISNFSGEN